MTERISVLLADWPNEDRLVGELFVGDAMAGYVRRIGDRFVATLAPTQPNLELDLDELIRALEQLRKEIDY